MGHKPRPDDMTPIEATGIALKAIASGCIDEVQRRSMLTSAATMMRDYNANEAIPTEIARRFRGLESALRERELTLN